MHVNPFRTAANESTLSSGECHMQGVSGGEPIQLRRTVSRLGNARAPLQGIYHRDLKPENVLLNSGACWEGLRARARRRCQSHMPGHVSWLLPPRVLALAGVLTLCCLCPSPSGVVQMVTCNCPTLGWERCRALTRRATCCAPHAARPTTWQVVLGGQEAPRAAHDCMLFSGARWLSCGIWFVTSCGMGL